MQELEKILEEIDDEIEKQRELCEDIENTPGWRLYEKAMNRAKDIIRKHMNDGWIPVEERLPEEDGFYLATMDGEIVGQKEPFTGLAEFENGKWIDDEDYYKCIIAWQPIPATYRPERIEE